MNHESSSPLYTSYESDLINLQIDSKAQSDFRENILKKIKLLLYDCANSVLVMTMIRAETRPYVEFKLDYHYFTKVYATIAQWDVLEIKISRFLFEYYKKCSERI